MPRSIERKKISTKKSVLAVRPELDTTSSERGKKTEKGHTARKANNGDHQKGRVLTVVPKVVGFHFQRNRTVC